MSKQKFNCSQTIDFNSRLASFRYAQIKCSCNTCTEMLRIQRNISKNQSNNREIFFHKIIFCPKPRHITIKKIKINIQQSFDISALSDLYTDVPNLKTNELWPQARKKPPQFAISSGHILYRKCLMHSSSILQNSIKKDLKKKICNWWTKFLQVTVK